MHISITGIGATSALGEECGALSLYINMFGRCGVSNPEILDTIHKELPVGELKYTNEDLKRMLEIPPGTVVSRTALLGAVALREALSSADIAPERMRSSRVVLVSGTTVGGMDITEQVFPDILKGDRKSMEYIRRHDCGSNTRQIAELAGLEGCEVCTVSTACSSGANAILLGCEMLRHDEADIVIAGGAEALSRFHLNGFNSLLILDREACRPFDATRAGLNLGEGSAYFVLERDVDWENSYAFVAGYGNRCDAFHQTASSENGEGAFLAMQEALRSAGVKPEEVGYVNAHGTGTPDNDASESAALRRLFGGNMPPVSSTKGYTGHTTSASGAIEAVITVNTIQSNIVPRNMGWERQDPACITPVSQAGTKNIDYALCNSFGFGGNDTSLLLSKYEHAMEPLPAEPHDSEIVSDVVIDSAEALASMAGAYISPREGRRMNRLMKAAMVASLKALEKAGVETPDAIVSATAYGMMETSEKFLRDLCEGGEQLVKPTLFMQSTHNTVGSAIAIRTRCHGYNVTYSQGRDSIVWAMRDARRLIAGGKARTVLVVESDESTPLLRDIFRTIGEPEPRELWARARVVKVMS